MAVSLGLSSCPQNIYEMICNLITLGSKTFLFSIYIKGKVSLLILIWNDFKQDPNLHRSCLLWASVLEITPPLKKKNIF